MQSDRSPPISIFLFYCLANILSSSFCFVHFSFRFFFNSPQATTVHADVCELRHFFFLFRLFSPFFFESYVRLVCFTYIYARILASSFFIRLCVRNLVLFWFDSSSLLLLLFKFYSIFFFLFSVFILTCSVIPGFLDSVQCIVAIRDTQKMDAFVSTQFYIVLQVYRSFMLTSLTRGI